MNVAAILARWDRIAFAQLCEHVATLAGERDEYRERAYRAEENADAWRDDCMRIMQETGRAPGLTIDGHLVALPMEGGNDG